MMPIKHAKARFQAVIFDLDGTLLDTLEDIADSMNAALARMGLPAHPVQAFRYLTGDGVYQLAQKSLPVNRRDETIIQDCIKAFRGEYRLRWANKARPYDGIPALLDELTARGLKLSILSNKLDEFTNLIAEKILANWKFSFVMGTRPDVPRKPDPAGALIIARELGFAPDRFLYLGDTDTDMRTAVAAGMSAVGALWGFRDERELIEGGAQALIASPLELLKFLD